MHFFGGLHCAGHLAINQLLALDTYLGRQLRKKTEAGREAKTVTIGKSR